MTAAAMPSTPEEIDLPWISEALKPRFPFANIHQSEIADIIAGTSTKVRVNIRADAGAGGEAPPPTVIVKGGFEEHSASLAPMYRSEARFYRDVLPLAPLRSPEAFFTHVDEEAHHSVVIMEDLRARGVEFCHPQRPQAFEQVQRRLNSLARFHAGSWESPHFVPGGRWDWITSRFSEWALVYATRYLEPTVWKAYIESPRGAAVSTRLHDGPWFKGALAKLGDLHRQSPDCLIHGDTHLGNLYIDSDGQPGFFDAQVARAPWHLEISYHIVGALDVVDRRRWERGLLKSYLAALGSAGAPAPDFDSAWLSYRRDILYGFFIFVINEIRFQTEAVNTACTSRYGAAMIDHDVIGLIDQL